MKKADIKTGVVYAYNAGRKWTTHSPAVVLSLDTYESSERTRDGEPLLTPCTSTYQTHGRRGSNFFGYDVGYPIAIGGDEDHERLLALTVDDLKTWVKGTTDERYEGLRLKAASGRELAGPWADVVAATEAEQEARRAEAQREQTESARARREAQDRVDRLRAAGIAVPDPTFNRETWTGVRLTLPQIDDLLARLTGTETP